MARLLPCRRGVKAAGGRGTEKGDRDVVSQRCRTDRVRAKVVWRVCEGGWTHCGQEVDGGQHVAVQWAHEAAVLHIHKAQLAVVLQRLFRHGQSHVQRQERERAQRHQPARLVAAEHPNAGAQDVQTDVRRSSVRWRPAW
jgi:hypothetical protein